MGETLEFGQGSLDTAKTELKVALALMEQLKGGLAERASWQTLREIFDNLLCGLPWFGYPIPAEYLLFRGRICNDSVTM